MENISYEHMILVKKLAVVLGKKEKEILNTPYVKLLEMLVDQHDIVILTDEINH